MMTSCALVNLLFGCLLLGQCFEKLNGNKLDFQLDFKLAQPIQTPLTDTWVRVMEDVYRKFLAFLERVVSNLHVMGLQKISEFQIAAVGCFDVLKGKVVNQLEQLYSTMELVHKNLGKAVLTGMCAIGELARRKQKELYLLVLDIVERFEAISQLTLHVLKNKHVY